MKTYHISGHLDLTLDEFDKHYAPAILTAINEGAAFVVGDAPGADALAQSFLRHRLYETAAANGTGTTRVVVYHMFNYTRNNVGEFATRGGYSSDEERDEAMTLASHDDIAWIRPGRKNTSTERNLKRRAQMRSLKED